MTRDKFVRDTALLIVDEHLDHGIEFLTVTEVVDDQLLGDEVPEGVYREVDEEVSNILRYLADRVDSYYETLGG